MHGRHRRRWKTILRAAGAEEVITIDRYAHLVGGARMAAARRGRRRRRRPPRLRRPQPLRRRRQHAAHPGRRQPGADHHGAGRPRRRPARPPGWSGVASPSSARVMTHARRPTDQRRHRSRVPVPDPGTRGRRHPAAGTPPPRSPSRLHRRRPHRPGLDLQQPGRGRGDHRPPRPARSAAATPSTSPAGWSAMHRACRNLGTRGLVMQAISAVDIALWDLKARLLDVPLCRAARAAAATRSRSTARAGSPP